MIAGISFNGYIFWGAISSLLFLASAPAVFHQLQQIWKRRALIAEGTLSELATESISLNQVLSSFLAVFSFFLFGIVLDTPDPFLTIPRAVVGLLLGWILFELYRERRTRSTLFALSFVGFAILLPFVLVVTGARGATGSKNASHVLVCLGTVLMVQGSLAQYLLLKKTGLRGAVSLPMHTVLYLKDFTGLMFGWEVGTSAWSIILMHASNLVVRAPIIFQYLKSK